MKKITLLLTIALFFVTSMIAQAQDGVINIVVLGSSTAAGTGPTNSSNAWVNLYRKYVKSINASSTVTNLAVGGYTTYQVMPSSFTAPSDRPSPDSDHNITKALSLSPDVIIINLPTNDVASSYTIDEQLYNYSVIVDSAAAQNVPVYITTTQPRNLSSTDLLTELIAMKDSTLSIYGNKAIDFWTTIANSDGTINSTYDSGDGVHLNDAAHILLASRVEAADILDYSVDDAVYDTINIDLGSSAALSTGSWNNLTAYTGADTTYLVNSDSVSTGAYIWVHDAFTGVNSAGTTSPATSTGFISTATYDSFFGNTVAFGGVTEATGGVTIAGLDCDNTYSITLFASRAGATDNREAMYIVVGSTKDTVYLNASSNTSNVVSVSGMAPASDGTIIINVAPGPNNNNSSKFYYLGAIRIIYEELVEYDKDGVIGIDFGSSSNTTSGSWNNLTAYAEGETLTDLVNEEGNNTGISVWIHDAFGGINEYGTKYPDTSLSMDSTATDDSFFGNTVAFYGSTEATAGITFTGLNADYEYTFEIFASRADITDNREAQYTVTGATTETVTLDAANNTSNLATTTGIAPDANGNITIDIAPGSNNTNSYKFYYLGAVRITCKKAYDDDGTIKIDFGSSSTTTSGWNNLTDYSTSGTISDLVNANENTTGITLSVHDAFTGINTAGTTSPDASLGIDATATSDSFYGNPIAYNGYSEATGGITFSGLDTATMYSFTIFASRAGVTTVDNREAQYVATGSTKDTVYLDATNNTSNVVTIKDLIPASDGTITIDVAPGSNNTNSYKFFYLGAIIVDYEKIVEYDTEGTISIDFGSSSNTTSGTWNNLTDYTTSGEVEDLINANEKKTGISLTVNDAFSGINTTGTTSPDASLGMDATTTSDSFYGNSVAYNSITEATGGITFSGLDLNTQYTFTIFASRAGITSVDNREAQYIAVGSTKDTAYLDATNNTSNVATIEDLVPASDGTITISVAPGANNTNSYGFYYLGAIVITYEEIETPVDYDEDGTINIDLGSSSYTTSGNWNNLTSATGGQTLALINNEGNQSGVSVYVHDAFTDVNLTGTTAPDASLNMDATATEDSFFGSTSAHEDITEATGGITLTGLNDTTYYTITLFASRAGVTDNREAQYTITGSTDTTLYLDAANNTSSVVLAYNMKPSTDGTITIDATVGPNNTNTTGYYYLGVVRIEYDQTPVTVTSVEELNSTIQSDVLCQIYPNPAKGDVTIDYSLPEAGKVQISIYNIIGQQESTLVNTTQPAGSYSIKWSGASNSGVYFCQIKVITANKAYNNTKKILIAR